MNLRVNVLALQHSIGLLHDALVLRRALKSPEIILTESQIGRREATIAHATKEASDLLFRRVLKYDINIHLEDMKLRWLPTAKYNWWVPNAEWIRTPLDVLRTRADIVLCKTRFVEAQLSARGFKTCYTGFSSLDLFDAAVIRERRALHVAGNSPYKGTLAVLEAWKQHPTWPELDLVWNAPSQLERALPPNITLYRSPISNENLRFLQNRALFHVCPSAVEGYGHTIAEALSCGACVISTNAPPMNELVSQERGILAEYGHHESLGLTTAFYVSSAQLASALNGAFAMTDIELALMCSRAREWFLHNQSEFEDRLRSVVLQGGPGNY